MDVDLEKLPRHLRAEAEQTITVARPKSMAAPIGDIHARGHMHPEDLDELDWAEAERAAVPKQMPTKGKGHSLKGLGRAMLMAPRRDADDEDAEESEYYSGSPYVMERGVPGLPRPPLAPPRGAIASPSASGPHPPSSLPPHMAKGKQDQWDDEQWDDEQWSDEQQDDWNYRANAMQEVKQASTHPWNDRKFWDREDEDSWEEDDQQLIKDAEEGLTVVPKGMAARPPRGAPPVAKAKMMQAAPKHKIAPSSAPIIPSRMDASPKPPPMPPPQRGVYEQGEDDEWEDVEDQDEGEWDGSWKGRDVVTDEWEDADENWEDDGEWGDWAKTAEKKAQDVKESDREEYTEEEWAQWRAEQEEKPAQAEKVKASSSVPPLMARVPKAAPTKRAPAGEEEEKTSWSPQEWKQWRDEKWKEEQKEEEAEKEDEEDGGTTMCPGGHKLVVYTTDDVRCACDRCEKAQPVGAKMHSCRKCNYDLCSVCRALPQPPQEEEEYEYTGRKGKGKGKKGKGKGKKGKGKGKGKKGKNKGGYDPLYDDERPDKFSDELWEEPRQDIGLKLIGELAPKNTQWEYVLRDENKRSFAAVYLGAYNSKQCDKFFNNIKMGTDWKQPLGSHGVVPRKTGWLVKKGCSCCYRYGGLEVEPQEFPPWMIELLKATMPMCGKTSPSQWPDCCNVNLYEDGNMSVGWHADDERLFQGKFQDIQIISLSFGQRRKFELRTNFPEGDERRVQRTNLGNGDLMTMEGMTQKHYMHRVPKEEGIGNRARINLTWRWILKHNARCPAARPARRDRRDGKGKGRD